MDAQEHSTNIEASEDSVSKTMNTIQERIVRVVSVILRGLEVCLAGVSIIVVIIGVCFLLSNLVNFWDTLNNSSLRLPLENALSDILLLVVGIELAIMLVRRRPEDLVDIIFFVIARKMLVKTGEFYELLIGVAALAGVFAIRKYLSCRSKQPAENN